MTYGFRRTRDGGVRVRLDDNEVQVVRSLVGQILELLEADAKEAGDDSGAAEIGMPSLGISGRTATPDDPVLARLFPDAYGDDAEAAGDFRRYTESGLRDGKRAAAATVLTGLDAGPGLIELTAEEAQAWLRALNDVRLALATRLGLTDGFHLFGSMDPTDPRNVYDWLTFLQETLVRAVR
ncbi:MAG: DUF2017 family protein [Streptosporangiales bacterium]|nr:DUF2017 family protein [Streptosporangiales bacterium]